MNQSVLVIDDEPMARMLLRLMLARDGFEVREAEDGLDALHTLESWVPDVVILDVMMPDIDGYSVCQQIRERLSAAELPVIMLSARADVTSINRGLSAGANKYLTKPVSPPLLIKHIRDLLLLNG